MGVSTVFRANKVISACNQAVPLCLIYNNDMLMYVTSTHTHADTLYVHVHVCMSVCNWWLPVFGLDWAATLQWGRGRLICTCCVGSPSLAPRPHFELPLLRVASTCAEANDDHSVRNAPEAAQKPIDYYLPHYISSFRDVSSEQIISFVRLDTFKVKRGGEREILRPWHRPRPFWPNRFDR